MNKIEKYVIKTEHDKYVSVLRHDSNVLYIWHSDTHLDQSTWFNDIESIKELLEARKHIGKKFKGFETYGLTYSGISPKQIQKITITSEIENIEGEF